MVDYRKKKKRHSQTVEQGRRGRKRTPFRSSVISGHKQEEPQGTGERLQKVLARLGLGARRKIDDLISLGQVLVNREPAVPGQRVFDGDWVQIGKRRLQIDLAFQAPRVLIYHKPEGEIVSRDDPQRRSSVFDKLPRLRDGRWIPIGRLDFNTCGLLLLTTSGELANHFMHPSHQIDRQYAVRIRGLLSDNQIRKLTDGIMLEDGLARVLDIVGPFGNEEEKNHWYHIVLQEGRNREVRRLFEAINANLTRLMRVRYGTIMLPPDLRRGCTQELTKKEVEKLIKDNFPEEAAWLLKGEPAPAHVQQNNECIEKMDTREEKIAIEQTEFDTDNHQSDDEGEFEATEFEAGNHQRDDEGEFNAENDWHDDDEDEDEFRVADVDEQSTTGDIEAMQQDKPEGSFDERPAKASDYDLEEDDTGPVFGKRNENEVVEKRDERDFGNSRDRGFGRRDDRPARAGFGSRDGNSDRGPRREHTNVSADDSFRHELRERSKFGDDRGGRSFGDRGGFGGAGGGDRPRFGDRDGNRGDRGGFGGGGDRPRFGDRDNRGGRSFGDRGGFGGGGDKPRFGDRDGNRGDRGGFGGGGDKPRFGDRDNRGGRSFGGGGDRPRFGDRDAPRGGFGGGGDRPRFGDRDAPRGDRGGFGGGDKPRFGDRGDRGGFGGDKPRADRPDSGERSGGGDRIAKSSDLPPRPFGADRAKKAR